MMHLFTVWEKAPKICRSCRRDVLTWNLKSTSKRLKTIAKWFLRSGSKYLWEFENSFRQEILLHSAKHMLSHPTLLLYNNFYISYWKLTIYFPVNQLHSIGCGPILYGLLLVSFTDLTHLWKSDNSKSINALWY